MEYHKRGFLNKVRGTAAFECNIDHEKGDYSYNSVCASFCITDCARKVELDFYTRDTESAENSLYKLNMLLTELQAFKNNLLVALSDAGYKEKE
jgi:hypothetical protein